MNLVTSKTIAIQLYKKLNKNEKRTPEISNKLC